MAFIKRLMDIVMSLGGLLLFGPVMIIIALAIVITDGFPVLFRQTRLGLYGREFTLLKFRSMVRGAEHLGSGIRVTATDTRITPVGAILRRWSLDELPQLFNVLRGDMSIVGPRPVLPHHPKKPNEYTHEERMRFTVRPGLTGLAQINGRGNVSWDKKLQFDTAYVRNQSILLDVKIIWRTLQLVFSGSDVYLETEKMEKGDHVAHNR